jgi:hypothetical protein
MKQDHVISDELFDRAQSELKLGNNWIAYNAMTYFLDKGDMYFFNNKADANDFARDNVSDVDDYRVLYADSASSLMRQLPYGDGLTLTEGQLEELFQYFDWEKTNYDPLHDTIEATTEEEKNDLAKMETLINGWESFYKCNPEDAIALASNYWESEFIENIKMNVMNEKNLKYLQDNVRNHGFGGNLQSELQTQLEKGAPEFRLAFQSEVNKRTIDATLYFKRSENTDMYFFNKYDVRVEAERNKEPVAQTFYLNKGQGVTLKEAYNLLNGRAVHKELTDKLDQKYQAWVQLDFNSKDKNGNYERKQYHQNYGFDLKEALSYYPLKGMDQKEEMDKFVRSLERGNVQMVTLEIPGKDVKVFMEANPQYKTITLYNDKMKRLDQEQRNELLLKPELKEEKGKSMKNEVEQKKTKVKEPSVNKGLIEKKRESKSKGLSV